MEHVFQRHRSVDQILRRQRWLVYMHHCVGCDSPSACRFSGSGSEFGCCVAGKALWAHVLKCSDRACMIPGCCWSKATLKHHFMCRDSRCPVCPPFRVYVERLGCSGDSEDDDPFKPFVGEDGGGGGGEGSEEKILDVVTRW